MVVCQTLQLLPKAGYCHAPRELVLLPFTVPLLTLLFGGFHPLFQVLAPNSASGMFFRTALTLLVTP